MSRSTIWKVYKTTATQYRELHNSWGTAPPLWGWLGQNYLGWEKPSEWLHTSDTKPLWELYENESVPIHMRFGLLATFDDGIVEIKDLTEAAKLARQVYDTIGYGPHKYNHWNGISKAYTELSTIKDKRVQGIALGCTSVSDPWWYRKERDPFSIFNYLDLAKENRL